MRDGHNFRAELEVMTGCGGIGGDRIEGEEEIVVEGYQWFKRNLHRKAGGGQADLGC